MNKLLIAAISAALFTSPVLAEETWTGFHLGVHGGTSELSVGPLDDSGAMYGIQAGYDHDFGKFIIGGEIDYSTAEYTIAGTTGDIDSLRLKLRGGYDLGRAMIYGIVGIGDFDDGIDSENGSTLGLGLSYKATENIIISGEYLRDSFDVLGIDIDVDSLSLRAAYKF
jgi:opacity protein-like surface antigen